MCTSTYERNWNISFTFTLGGAESKRKIRIDYLILYCYLEKNI